MSEQLPDIGAGDTVCLFMWLPDASVVALHAGVSGVVALVQYI